jgi:adenylylsulfate kinase
MSGGDRREVMIVTGPIGVGKTTMLEQLAAHLTERRVAHSLIDMDWLRAVRPRPTNDPYHSALGYRNLADVARNALAVGATHFVIADVVETRSQRSRYQAAIPGAMVTIVRLTADIDVIRQRIAHRADGDPDPWEADRAAELVGIMSTNNVGDLVIDTTDRTPRQVASDILARLDWA